VTTVYSRFSGLQKYEPSYLPQQYLRPIYNQHYGLQHPAGWG
jgi:hypothetical protein